jgi:hypothetical protein
MAPGAKLTKVIIEFLAGRVRGAIFFDTDGGSGCLTARMNSIH